MITRLENWDEQLKRYLKVSSTKPFEWGVQDCATWAAGAVDAMCGTTFADGPRNSYDTAEDAVVYMNARGWKTLADAAKEILGEPIGPGSLARRGDVFYMDTPPVHNETWNRGALLICVGGEMVGPSTEGLVWFPKRIAVMLRGQVFHV